MKKLVYVMDPQCGWCYGNSDNIIALQAHFKDKLDLELMVGGMWLTPQAPKGGKEMNNFIVSHSPQMEKTTGAHVDKAFYKLTKNEAYTFSSLEPAAAIIWVKNIYPDKYIAFAKEVQKAIFAKGKRLDLLETYESILAKMEIDGEEFKKYWLSAQNLANTQKEFVKARALANGYPSLLLLENDNYTKVASGFFNVENMIELIEKKIQ